MTKRNSSRAATKASSAASAAPKKSKKGKAKAVVQPDLPEPLTYSTPSSAELSTNETQEEADYTCMADLLRNLNERLAPLDDLKDLKERMAAKRECYGKTCEQHEDDRQE